MVAEAFSRVLASLQLGAGPDVAFRLYLFSVIRRTAESPAGAGGSATEPQSAARSGDLAARAFRSLPERAQTLLWRTEIEGQPPGAVAGHLGMSPNAVAALAYHAREGLRHAHLDLHVAEEEAPPCGLVQERLGAYGQGVLIGGEAARVSRHLRTCTRCEALRLDLTDVHSVLVRSVAPLYLGRATDGYLDTISLGGPQRGPRATGGQPGIGGRRPSPP